MELEIATKAADYRLIFFQPDPESGERVCVGVSVGEDLLYDEKFSRARCLSRELDVDILRFYLHEMRQKIVLGRERLELILQSFAPLFASSPPKKITLPVTEAKKLRLFERFVLHKSPNETESAPSGTASREIFVRHLREFTDSQNNPPFDAVIENARAKDILGMSRPHLGTVALALKRKSCTFLIDGVDLNLLTPKEALQQSQKVTHTFWQYKRLGDDTRNWIKRIGVVFNGNSASRPDYRDIHDFALDQFRNEADWAVDASADDSRLRWRQLVANACGPY